MRDGYVLDGVATFADYAQVADVILAIAEFGDKLSAFLVPPGAADVQITKVETVDGVPTARVAFSDVHLGAGDMLGAPGQGECLALVLANWGAASRATMPPPPRRSRSRKPG